ncbi:PepSY-associated TM helix domain-containing protein [Campylobacter canadensis]|uniref:PepSY domain-containing protein n=1 Tax=Campylobacter canadensis TaxID=449520 RepID=A0ABS7WU25_9BACT|nr:PepSY-associated TM helix domain-containing protein [Campylobacter canadensis]MBZ7987891.1 PepSY domain-containing protein [Campylobacter canadensis]MBZ7998365.1 PepSY domain-containing protein [Campylobacter canadensis]
MKVFRVFHSTFAVVLCWFLFFISFFGCVSYINDYTNYYMQPSIQKNHSKEVSLNDCIDYAQKEFKDYETINVATPTFYNNLCEINYFNANSTKAEKKSNIAYFDGEEKYTKTPTLGAKFLFGMHYKIFPFKSTQSIIEALISIVAFCMFLIILSGFFIIGKKKIFELKGKNPYAKNYDFHILVGTFIAVFLGFLSLSGIALNYAKDIDKFFTTKVQKKQSKEKVSVDNSYIFDTNKILEFYSTASDKLGTKELIITLNKAKKQVQISPIKNINSLKSFNQSASNNIVFDEEKILEDKSFSVKNNSFWQSVYEISFTFHRVKFAPIYLSLLLFACGILACVFIYKAMQMYASKKKKANYLALANSAFFSCFNASIAYLIANKILSADLANRALMEQSFFYAIFVLSFALSFIFYKKQSILNYFSIALLVILLLCDFIFSYYSIVTVGFNIMWIIFIIFFARRKNGFVI